MKITEEEYKYMFIRDKIKKSMVRGDQKRISEKMQTDSQKISGIVNGSRITTIDGLKEIALNGAFSELDFEKLEEEASREAHFQRYGSYPGSNLSEIGKLDDKELLNAVFKMNGHRMSESDMRIIQSVIDGSDEL